MYGRYREDLGEYALTEARKNSLAVKRDSIAPSEYDASELKKRSTAWKLKRTLTGMYTVCAGDMLRWVQQFNSFA